MDESATPHGVVVGTDGSKGARAAVACGLREAQLRGLGVRLVTVWPEGRPLHVHDGGIGPVGIAEFERDVRSRMRAAAADVAGRTGCDLVPVHPEVRYGHPAEQLVDAAGRDGLLIVGSRGLGASGGLLLGSVSQHCAQHARGTVIVVRDGQPTDGTARWQGTAGRVVVGVDGSSTSLRALWFAAAEARLRGGGLHVVHAWLNSVTGYGGTPWAVPAATLEEQAAAVLLDSVRRARWSGALGTRDVQLRAETIEGIEREVLVDAARGADLLVVGSRGRARWAALLLGSVARHCITSASCPVAVVRAPAEGA